MPRRGEPAGGRERRRERECELDIERGAPAAWRRNEEDEDDGRDEDAAEADDAEGGFHADARGRGQADGAERREARGRTQSRRTPETARMPAQARRGEAEEQRRGTRLLGALEPRGGAGGRAREPAGKKLRYRRCEDDREEEEQELDTSDEEGVRAYEDDDLPGAEFASPRALDANKEDCALRAENGAPYAGTRRARDGNVRGTVHGNPNVVDCENGNDDEGKKKKTTVPQGRMAAGGRQEASVRRASLDRALCEGQRALLAWVHFRERLVQTSSRKDADRGIAAHAASAPPGQLGNRRRSSGLSAVLTQQLPARKRTSGASPLQRASGLVAGLMNLTPRHRRLSSTSTAASGGAFSTGGSLFGTCSSDGLRAARSFTLGSSSSSLSGASLSSLSASSSSLSLQSYSASVASPLAAAAATGSSCSSSSGSSDSITTSPRGLALPVPVDQRPDLVRGHVRGTSDGGEWATSAALARSLDDKTPDLSALLGNAYYLGEPAGPVRRSGGSGSGADPAPSDAAGEVPGTIQVSRRGSTNTALVSSTAATGVTSEGRRDGLPRGVLSRRWRTKIQACDFAGLIFLFQWHPQFARVALFETTSTPENARLRKQLCNLLLAKLWHRPDVSMAHRWAIASVTGHALLQEFKDNPDIPLRSTSVASHLLAQIVAQPLCVGALNRAIKADLDRAVARDPANSTPVDLARRVLDALLVADFPAVLYDVCRQIGRLAVDAEQRIALVGGCFFILRYVNPAIVAAAVSAGGASSRDPVLIGAARLLQSVCSRASISTALPGSSAAAETEAKFTEADGGDAEAAFVVEGVPKIRELIDRLCVAPYAITFAQSLARAETLLDLDRSIHFEHAQANADAMPWGCVSLSITDLQLLAQIATLMSEPRAGGCGHEQCAAATDNDRPCNRSKEAALDVKSRESDTAASDGCACLVADMDAFQDFVKPRLAAMRSLNSGSQKDADNLYLEYEPHWLHAMPSSLRFISPRCSPASSPPSSPSSVESSRVGQRPLSEDHHVRNLRLAFDALLLL